MKISNNTCKGVTPVNEDYFIGRQLTDIDAIAVLCDGMGGLSFGDVAAKTVAETIASYTCKRYTPNTDLKSLLEQAVLTADSALANVAMDYHSKMGTAVAAVLVADNNAYITWLGNVRVYIVGKDDSIRLLTYDHADGKTEMLEVLADSEEVRSQIVVKQEIVDVILDGF